MMSEKSQKIFNTKSLYLYFLTAALILSLVFTGSSGKNISENNSMDMKSIASNNYNVSADQLSEFYTVSEFANSVNLPTAEAINVNYNSLSVLRDIGQVSAEKIKRPDIVDTSHIARGVITHVVAEGETLATIAAHYGVSETQIRWSNGMSNSSVTPGQTLSVPSVPGIIYTVKSGDTIQSLAQKYGADLAKILSVNNFEPNQQLKPGSTVVLPSGVLPANERPESNRSIVASTNAGTAAVSQPSYRTYWTGSNPMPWGWCTWYAWERRASMGGGYQLPGGLGNANTWSYALAGSFIVNGTPAAGAVFQTGYGYYGHVGIVERVNSDGSIEISDMNGPAGWGRVGHQTIPSGSLGGYRFIHGRR